MARGVDFHKGNSNIKVTAISGKIFFYLNNQFVFSANHSDAFDGDFGIATQDAYIGIGRMIAYRDTPFIVPLTDTVRDYYINIGTVLEKASWINELRSKSISLITDFIEYNDTVDCAADPFYCRFLNLPNDISFYLSSSNLTRIIEKIPVEESLANYVLYPSDKNSSFIDWTDFSIAFSYNQIREDSPAAIIAKFGDKWAVMINRNNSYFFVSGANGTRVDEIRNPVHVNVSIDKVIINVTSGNISLKVNNVSVFSRIAPADYTNGYLQLYNKNEYIQIPSAVMTNNDPVCRDPLNFRFCQLTLELGSSRRQTTSQQQEDYYIEYSSYSPSERKATVIMSTAPATIISNETNAIGNASAAPQANYTAFTFDFPIYNPFIPDRKIILNSTSTIISNFSNFSLDYSYQALDGAKVLQLGFRDIEGNDLLLMYILERQNKILLFYNNGTSQARQELRLFINQSNSHSIGLNIIEGNATFYFDRREISRINKTGIRQGFFYLGAKNTYPDLGTVSFKIFDLGLSRNLAIRDNPCDLKLIYREEKENRLKLSPGQSVKISGLFNINQDFDYGKVFVELYGSSNMTGEKPLEVHFWVVRDDYT